MADPLTPRRTVADWLTHARMASSPTDVESCLDAAAGEADTCGAWRELLGGVAALPGVSRQRIAAVAEHTLQLAVVNLDVWACREVAGVRAGPLEDRAAAAEALDACRRALGEPRPPTLDAPFAIYGMQRVKCYQWVILADGYTEVLGDRDGMLGCLRAARDVARLRGDADGLCSVATAWGRNVDPAEALAMMREAEALAANGSARAWTLANGWRALGDDVSVRRVLHEALARSTRHADALDVARAWATEGDADELRTALTVAVAHATTALECLSVAEAARDGGLDRAVVGVYVKAAEALVANDNERSRVAAAWRLWLGDEQAATRLGPIGLRPEGHRTHTRTLPGWEASASGLLDWLRAGITPASLLTIAHSDYGSSVEGHLAALRDICETGCVPVRLAWEPHEVLALTRWSEGERVDHRARALCCLLLSVSGNDMEELATNGPILAESCLVLGAEASGLAEGFFVWFYETDAHPPPTDDPFVPAEAWIALTLLFIVQTATVPDDPRLVSLAARLLNDPARPLKTVSGCLEESMRKTLWNDLVDAILVPRQGSYPHVLRVVDALKAAASEAG